MISMKRTPEEVKEEKKAAAVNLPSENEYPWGLRINLENDEIKKLGIDENASAGEFMIVAKAVVTNHTRRTSQKTLMSAPEFETYMELQITDMEMKPAPNENAGLYDNS